jgi:hypothetical protein
MLRRKSWESRLSEDEALATTITMGILSFVSEQITHDAVVT